MNGAANLPPLVASAVAANDEVNFMANAAEDEYDKSASSPESALIDHTQFPSSSRRVP